MYRELLGILRNFWEFLGITDHVKMKRAGNFHQSRSGTRDPTDSGILISWPPDVSQCLHQVENITHRNSVFHHTFISIFYNACHTAVNEYNFGFIHRIFALKLLISNAMQYS